MSKRKLFVVVILHSILLNGAWGANQNDYQKGWEAFNANNRVDARKFFNASINDPTTKSDALLSLCLLDWNEFKMDAAFEDFRRFYESTSNPYPYLYSLSSLPFLFEQGNVLAQNKVRFFEKIVSDPGMNGTLKAMIYQDLGSNYEKINNFKMAKELYAQMGTINHWQVLGTFDNTSGSGFSKDWGAISNATNDKVFKNKVDADVNWFTPSCNKANNWFYFDYPFILNNTIMYAQSFVTSPLEQEVYLRAGTSGSVKIWVNDALVISEPEERNCDLDIYACKIKLNPGVNRILIQIGQSEIDNANFMVRLTDIKANPIPGLSNTAEYSEYIKSSNQVPCEILPFFAEDFFIGKLKESPENPLNSLLLAEIYLRNDKAYEATKILKSTEVAAPASTLVSFRLAEAYSRANNQTDYDKEMENIKRLDPNSFIGLQEAYNDAIKSEKYTDAVDICKIAKELYGENETTENWDINLASFQKRYDDVIALGKILYTKYPYRYDMMNLNYQIEKNTSKNPNTSIAIIEAFCNNYFNTNGLELLSKAYFDQGNTDKGIAVLKKRLKNMPYATGYLDNLMTALFHKQKYEEALEVSDQILAISPYLSGTYNSRGYLYKNLKMNDKAIENFRKSVYYGPTSYDSRSQLRLLENKKEMSDLFPKNNLDELITNAPTIKEYPQDNAVLLLNDYQLIVYPEGAKEYRCELATKILNQSGIDNWKQYNIKYNGNSQRLLIDKAEVIKANGTKVKAETDNDNRVVFTNLEVNDVLHLDYRVQDLSAGKLANHFFDHFLFQYGIPSIINRCSILAPKNKSFNYLVSNGNIDPKISDIEDMKLYQWELNNQPAIKQEPYISTLSDIAPILYYSSVSDWKYISDWYKDLTSSKFKSDYVLKETVGNLLKGKENFSDREKAGLFYNYILENISYSSVSFLQGNFIPQKASRTITTRLGDCKDVSTLFVALCREVGINANLVLISTRNNGNSTMLLPANDFNHCITQLILDDKKYYLELTDNMLPFGAALIADLNSEILPIPFGDEAIGEKLLRMEMPFRQKNKTIRFHNISIVNNDMQIVRQTRQFGAFSSSVRNSSRGIGSDEQLKNLSQSVASDFSVPIKISNLKYTNLDNLEDSMFIDYKIEIKNALQEVAGMKIMKFPWTERISSLDIVTEETRKYPLQLWSYMPDEINSEEMIINLPLGKKFVELPKDEHFGCANASYDLTFDTKTPGKVIVRRIIHRKSEQVSIQEYSAFRDFMNRVSELDNKQYAIKN